MSSTVYVARNIRKKKATAWLSNFIICFSFFTCFLNLFCKLLPVSRNTVYAVCLSPHFRLVQMGERRTQDGSMEGIDALLGKTKSC